MVPSERVRLTAPSATSLTTRLVAALLPVLLIPIISATGNQLHACLSAPGPQPLITMLIHSLALAFPPVLMPLALQSRPIAIQS